MDANHFPVATADFGATLAITMVVVYLVAFLKATFSSASSSLFKTSPSRIIFAILTVIIAIAAVYIYFFNPDLLKFSFFDIQVIGHALAQTGTQQAAAPFVNIIIIAIFVVFLLGLCGSMVVLFTTEDTQANQKKLASADTIFKTFSGFFVGVLTAFIKQAFG
jgi:hypothetical protein